ncbi:sensor histidine kinase [Sphaerisporangium album]|uniref:histidine kinase n=1 Tax=Sphaerisporangium album TaxID=509200 RepID=A0A367FRA4_9ACTN|nr:HAMP domain-containing sensor histidine kinase [Sphaerisporangium album]RCG32439.1 sensor histidine kinase [Sphaerisporangium album]
MDLRRLTRLCDYIDAIDMPAESRRSSDMTPAHPGEDEIDRTIRTVTSTLGGLNRALRRQRDFASDASHELRTPLAGLRAQLEEALLHPGEQDLHEVLTHALDDIDRMEAVMGDLLLLSRLNGNTPAERRPVNLALLVQAEVSRRMDKIALRTRLDQEVHVDIVPIQIGRLLTNLLDNAQRYARSVVAVDVTRHDGTGELAVSDDGCGIAEADRERVFERFTRLCGPRGRDRGGTGLGLAIAREIADATTGSCPSRTRPSAGRVSRSGFRWPAKRLPPAGIRARAPI